MTEHDVIKESIRRLLIALIVCILVYIVIIIMSQLANAQNVIRHNNTFIEQIDSVKRNIQSVVTETDYLYKDKNGQVYNIYLSSNGNAFIVKISQKSGRKYRKYLPEITKQLGTKHEKANK